MPKREDEFWAGMKEPKGQGLCPFCGSPNVYYNKHYKSWRCGKCEKSFPSPSYGPGEDFGKEARWFGKTTEQMRRREFAEAAGKARAEKRKESSRGDAQYPFHPERVGYYRGEYPSRTRKRKGLPGWLIPGLVVFLVMMFGVAVWGLWGSDITQFLVSTTSTSPREEVLPSEQEGVTVDREPPIVENGISIFEGRQPPYAKTFGQSIHLINNSSATNPTWRQLVAFLLADKTDEESYSIYSFACGAFAEEIHNNAEAAGLRAAWVAVDFEDDSEGHALNAFNTADRGLVYVDCTGRDVLILVRLVLPPGVEQKTFGGTNGWDKITYVEIGKEYGIISLEVASSPAYAYYAQYKQRLLAFKALVEQYNQKVAAFNLEVEKYNGWISGRILYEGTSEALRAEQWFQELNTQEDILKGIEEELDEEGNSLGAFWESLGIVKNVEIYW